MIDLRVEFDRSMVDRCRAGNRQPLFDAWTAFCGEAGLEAFADCHEMFALEHELSAQQCLQVERLARHLVDSRERSLRHLAPFLPRVSEPLRHRLTVTLLPGGRHCFGPRPGRQVFALRPGADPEEAYLFLVHVYYHELTGLFATERSRQCSEARRNADEFRHWIRLLVRNEGIANYAVLSELLDLRALRPGCEFRYFTYADQIGDDSRLALSARLLAHAFQVCEEADEPGLDALAVVLKDKALPAINLTGLHMARVVAGRFGLTTLTDVYGKEPEEFFALYAETATEPRIDTCLDYG